MTQFIANNIAPIMFAGLIVFMLIGFPVAFSLGGPVLPASLAAAAIVAAITGRAAVRWPETAQVATGLALASGLALGVLGA